LSDVISNFHSTATLIIAPCIQCLTYKYRYRYFYDDAFSFKFHLPGFIGWLVVTIKLKGKENFALLAYYLNTLYNSIQHLTDTEVSVNRVSPTL